MANETLSAAIAWLEKEHDVIMGHEQKALDLMKEGNIDGYRKEMKAKAEAISKLADAARPVIRHLPKDRKRMIADTLEQFSGSAALSLELESVFYWSALLYPDVYTAGDPDNLEKFIMKLKEAEC